MNQLRSFYMAARSKSISRAAEALMVTPPAITIQVKQLEETIGIRLLVRAGNAIRLTEAGERVFKRAERIFQQIHEMEGFLEDMATGKSGELHIGCPEIPLKRLMPMIEVFKKTYPGIRVILDQGSNSDMVKSVEAHRNELAVIRYRNRKDLSPPAWALLRLIDTSLQPKKTPVTNSLPWLITTSITMATLCATEAVHYLMPLSILTMCIRHYRKKSKMPSIHGWPTFQKSSAAESNGNKLMRVPGRNSSLQSSYL